MKLELTYQNTLDYLYSFVDYSLTKADRLAQAKFDLTRMHRLLEELGNPHHSYPSIHITGTKGKGSVTAMCTSVLREAGYRVGMYTSPHLEDYAERIQVNGENIPHAALVSFVESMKPAIEKIKDLTTFEITTALAFLYFNQKKVDVAVVEVGLGGRLDATNVLLPEVSVITSISFDHTFVLGNTLAEIAREKGGIIKEG
ncbi:MAG: bifunctional folylpolyglutamate synthase/dihydrofolate synthase, partial [Anaerolineales bacterium]